MSLWKHGTIEFMLWPGTVNAKEIYQFVMVSLSMVNLAHSVDQRDLDSLIENAWNPDFDVIELLKVIGVSTCIVDHFKRHAHTGPLKGFQPPWQHDKDRADVSALAA